MALEHDLERVAAAAAAHGAVTGVLAAEPSGPRRYLVALGDGDDRRWLVLDDAGAPVSSRADVRNTASIVAMCELAAELAGDETAPRVASPAFLDALGERVSPHLDALRAATGTVEEFVRDVERGYLITLS